MPTKAQTYAELAELTAERLTSSLANWTGFLSTVGRLYKYPYHEQLMIYAQRPDATACADYELWNDKMNRFVRRGSKGIALLDHTGEKPRLKYVFDVSDTSGRENSRRPFLWEMEEHHHTPVLEMLQSKYDVQTDNIAEAIDIIARDLATEYYHNHKRDFSVFTENSFLEEYDEDNIRAAFINAGAVSTAYTLMKRCGLETEEYFTHEDFLPVFDFNTADAACLLGTAVSEQSEEVLRQISLTISKTERERSNEHERNNLLEERGLSDTQPHIDTADGGIGQVRQNEENISGTAPHSPIQLDGTEREAVPTPTGDRPNSQPPTHADNGGLAENTDTARQDDPSDGMGSPHEQSESPSGRNDTDGVNLQLSLFPTEQQQIQRIAESEQPSAFSSPFLEKGRELAAWLNDFFNSLPTKYQGTFEISSVELKRWEHISSKAENLTICIKSPIADYSENSFTYFNKDKTDENALNEAIYNSPLLSRLQKDKDFSISFTPSMIMVFFHNFKKKEINLSNEERFIAEPQELLPPPPQQQAPPQLSPLWQEYSDIKTQNPNAIVLYQVGDFFEVMADDPKTVANEFEFTLTSRDVGLPERVPMCGFPSNRLEENVFKLHENGHDVLLAPMENGERKTLYLPSMDTAVVEAVQAELDSEITPADIDNALQQWNGEPASKRRVTEYMESHSRERGTAEWLKNEYGGNQPAFVVTKGDLTQELPWAKVQRRLAQLVTEEKFFTDAEYDSFDKVNFAIGEREGSLGYDVDFNELKERLASDEPSPFVEQVMQDVEQIAATEQPTPEAPPFPYNIGDAVYLENGTKYFVDEIGRFNVSLRDPTLFYPVLRSASKENFLRLIDRFPQNTEPQQQAENFHITDEHLGEGSKREKYQRNIAAITTLQTIEKENRNATPEEQEILSQYIGWGGLSEVFDKTNSSYASEYVQLKSLLSEDEYEMARASILNAHYTTPTVIKAIYDTVEQMGQRDAAPNSRQMAWNILEPACGVGNFFGMLPESMEKSNLYGIELDSITGRIAKQLYPNANISVQGFEKAELPDSFFDLAIGNVPFGNYKLSEKRYDGNNFLIHDHFFAKSLDKVRPGGVVAFITSKGTMDKQSPEVRRYLAQHAELLGAVRLPNNAFSKNAGTEVTGDILFLQKRDRPIDVNRDWIYLDTDDNGLTLNSYFAEHPEMVLGNMVEKSGPFGMETACVPIEGANLADQLKSALSTIEGEIPDFEVDLSHEVQNGSNVTLAADPTVKNFSYTLVDGEVYYRENSRMVKPYLNQTAMERVAGLVELRECVGNLIRLQLEDYSDADITAEQVNLNALYDRFTNKYGLINSRGNSLAFSDDNSYYLLCSLEDVNEDGTLKAKADMFTKRTIKKRVTVTSVDTASEALALSIAEKAKVDMPYMSELTGKTEQQIAEDLQGVIFYDFANPDHSKPPFDSETMKLHEKFPLITADEFLSGNVREKLRKVQQFRELMGEDFQGVNISGYVRALEQAQPKDLEASEIDVRLGATWIDKEYIEQFMYELFDTPWRLQGEIAVKYAPFTAEWNITNKNAVGYNNVAAYTTFGTERANAYRILEDTLNLRDVRIYDTVTDPDGKERRVLNKDATTLAQQKQQTIKDEFRDWIFKDADRRQTLVQKYNDLFNSIRPREYDGRHINFGGINPEISLREHQINAIAHVLYGNNTLLAHEVGAGKTFEMVAAAMESKRLGLCQKPLFAVPNHLTEQWASEFLRLYPAADILVATKKDFEMKNRKKFCARIATGDYDAVIIGHSQFERIPMSLERQERLLREQIDEIIDGIEEVKASGGERFTVKQLERTKKGLEERLKKLEAQERKDDVVTFEQLGVDRLYVDEAHSYKNLFLYTKMRNVAGLATTDAQKSSDMFLKCRYMDELTGGKGIVFATGTPVSNSMTELYTMQRYLQYNTLQKNGLAHFDCWASTFGETVTAIELAPEGTGYRARTRFSKFFNLPELMSMFKEVADIKTADQLDLPTPTVNYHTVAVKPTELQTEMVKDLSERAAEVHANKVDPSVDNMLKITSDGRKLGLDQRIINPMLPDDERSKVNACINNIHKIWDETSTDRLTQLVFCDISTPKPRAAAQEQKAAKAGSKTINGVELATLEDSLPDEVPPPTTPFNVYDDIRNKLVERGVPAEEVAFIHEANTEVRKKELFAKVRSGDVRVLIGSTAKCGAGTNIQDRLAALHDLDCPWRPGDLTQRSGRIERQGNINEEVDIFRYVTEATFDAYLWQTVENKQKFISQIMTSKSPVRSCEDVDEAALSYAEIKALCAGNPKIKQKMDLDIDVARLKLLKSNHQSSQYRLEDNLIKYFPENIEKNKGFIKGFEKDLQTLAANTPKEGEFSPMVIKGDTLIDKDNAGAALLEACKEVKSSEPVEVGSYRGFTMQISFDSWSKEFNLTLKGEMSHSVKLGLDARGNLTRIDNALTAMPQPLQSVRDQLDNLYKQEEAARLEIGKPFPQELELKEKTALLATLDAELNMDAGKGTENMPTEIIAKDRPSVLDSLKQQPQKPANASKKSKPEREER